jgi:hypothetical protein
MRRAFKSWAHMRARCSNPTDAAYANYGGRGIKVCERWGDFATFLADMGPPGAGQSIERLNNDAGYSPDNCIWADKTTQANNRRSSRLITAFGKTQTLAQWAKERGMRPGTLCMRLNGWGWDIERALTTPVITPKRRLYPIAA